MLRRRPTIHAGRHAKTDQIMAAVTILLWRFTGFKLSLSKGTMGRFVDWIGFSFQLTHTQLVARIEEDKIADLLATSNNLKRSRHTIDRKQLRAFTGLLEWMQACCFSYAPLSGMCLGGTLQRRGFQVKNLEATSTARVHVDQDAPQPTTTGPVTDRVLRATCLHSLPHVRRVHVWWRRPFVGFASRAQCHTNRPCNWNTSLCVTHTKHG